MKGFYYIENTLDERSSTKTGYTETLEEAKEVLKYCSDWFCDRGTGRIFFQPVGVKLVKKYSIPYGKTEPVARIVPVSQSPKFICRGKGLDENGEVIFTDNEW